MSRKDLMTRFVLLSAFSLCAAPAFAAYATSPAMSPVTTNAAKASNTGAPNASAAQNNGPGVQAMEGEGRWNLDKGCATEPSSAKTASTSHAPGVQAMMGEGRWNLDRDPNCLYG